MKIMDKKIKIIIIIVLVAVIGISVGFAAFTSTLNISSSATVKPDDSAFKVEFSSTSTSVVTNSVAGVAEGGATAGIATLTNTAISGLTANFTAPGQTVTYTFYVHNTGEYDAYLREIVYKNVDGESSSKVCKKTSTDTTESLVEAACDDITITTKVGEFTTDVSNSGISGHALLKNNYETVTITIAYAADGDRADGDFTVEFGDIGLTYNSNDSNDYELDTETGEGEWPL